MLLFVGAVANAIKEGLQSCKIQRVHFFSRRRQQSAVFQDTFERPDNGSIGQLMMEIEQEISNTHERITILQRKGIPFTARHIQFQEECEQSHLLLAPVHEDPAQVRGVALHACR